MSLCALYFSSSALQFWCTNYIITVIKVKPSTGHLIFGITSITSPLLGAAFGGSVTDSYVSWFLNKFWLNRCRVVTKENFKLLQLKYAVCLHQLHQFLRYCWASYKMQLSFQSFFGCFCSLAAVLYQQQLESLWAQCLKTNKMLHPLLVKWFTIFSDFS